MRSGRLTGAATGTRPVDPATDPVPAAPTPAATRTTRAAVSGRLTAPVPDAAAGATERAGRRHTEGRVLGQRPAATRAGADRASAAASPTAAAAGVALAERADDLDDDDAADAAAETEAPAPAAADADQPDEPPRPVRPVDPRRRRLGIGLGQLLAWEIAGLAVLAAHRERPAVLVPVAVAAALVLGLTTIRVGGRWLHQWAGLAVRYAVRRRTQPLPADPDAATLLAGLLAAALPGARVTDLELEEPRSPTGGYAGSGPSEVIGLVEHAGGLTAVVEVSTVGAGPFLDPSAPLPPLTALLPPGEPGDPVLSAQVLLHAIPAPSLLAELDGAAFSYQELAAPVPPAGLQCYLAVQALHTAEEFGSALLRDHLLNAVHRLQRRLRKAGLHGRVLTADDIGAAYLALAGLDEAVRAPTRRRLRRAGGLRERWRCWQAAGRVHTSYRLLHPPPPGADWDPGRLLLAPALTTTLSLAVRRAGPDVEVEVAIRLCLPGAERIDEATRGLARLAGAARLQRMDAQHAAGLTATLPTGGYQS